MNKIIFMIYLSVVSLFIGETTSEEMNSHLKGKYKFHFFELTNSAGWSDEAPACYLKVDRSKKVTSEPIKDHQGKVEVFSCSFPLGYFKHCSLAYKQRLFREDIGVDKSLYVNKEGLWFASLRQERTV